MTDTIAAMDLGTHLSWANMSQIASLPTALDYAFGVHALVWTQIPGQARYILRYVKKIGEEPRGHGKLAPLISAYLFVFCCNASFEKENVHALS